jgi:hypothetical protein
MSTLTTICLVSLCVGQLGAAVLLRWHSHEIQALRVRLQEHEEYGATILRLRNDQEGQPIMDLTVEDLVSLAQLKAGPLDGLTIAADGKIIWQWHGHTPQKG